MVAQLGTTYQTLSLSFDSWRASVTSWGFIAAQGALAVTLKIFKRLRVSSLQRKGILVIHTFV